VLISREQREQRETVLEINFWGIMSFVVWKLRAGSGETWAGRWKGLIVCPLFDGQCQLTQGQTLFGLSFMSQCRECDISNF